MNEAQVNALIGALETQRNTAMNALAESNANLTLANERLQQLAAQLDDLLKQQSSTSTTEVPSP